MLMDLVETVGLVLVLVEVSGGDGERSETVAAAAVEWWRGGGGDGGLFLPWHRHRMRHRVARGVGGGEVAATLTFWMRIFSGLVPTCAAMSFLRSPMVSSSFTLTRTFFPSRSLQMTSIMAL